MTERLFTDREVARVLERATELDRTGSDRRGDPHGGLPTPRGLTLAQLQDIGREVGIPADLIARAVAEVDRPARLTPEALLGASPVRRQIRSVPAKLEREHMAELVRVVDRRVPAQGTATEALGAVRWSADGRFLDRQVSLEPGDGETLIRVEERWETRVPALLQGVPAAYGAGFGLVIGTGVLGGGAALGLAGALILGVVAWVLGRLAWGGVADRSGERTRALADELAEVASRIAGDGPPGPGG